MWVEAIEKILEQNSDERASGACFTDELRKLAS